MRITIPALVGALMLSSAGVAQAPVVQRDLVYGAEPLQRLDFYPAPDTRGPTPLILFVHGGGWSRGSKGNATGAAKIAHFTARGWAVGSIDYRLVPDATVEQSAQDVADAVGWTIRNAAKLGVAPRRVILMGHSAGAHLAALIATDPQYLAHANVRMDRLAGVVLLDGAGYDVPRQMSGRRPAMLQLYGTAFGQDPARQRRLSPTMHAAAPNIARFLILHVGRPDSRDQSEGLAQALTAAGSQAVVRAIDGTGLRGHMEINRSLGEPAYAATPIVDEWLTRAFAAVR